MNPTYATVACVLCVGGCGGGMVFRDAGGDTAVDTPNDSVAATDLVVQLVDGPRPTHPSLGTTVVATGSDGTTMTAMTDATGTVHFPFPASGATWTITAFRSGMTAISIAGVTTTLAGVIRIDPLVPEASGAGLTVSGTISGADPSDSVQIDAMNFVTVPGAHGSYSTQFYAPGTDLPLVLAALELDASGNVVNAVSTLPLMPRPNAPTTVDITLPSPRVAPTVSTVTISLPSTGLIDTTAQIVSISGVEQWNQSDHEEAWMLVGTAQALPPGPGTLPIQLSSFDGGLEPNVCPLQLRNSAGSAVLDVLIHTFATDSVLTIDPIVSLELAGSTAGEVAMTADAVNVDSYALTISAPGAVIPAWRLYTIDGQPVTSIRLPQVPAVQSAVAAELGVGGAVAFAMAIRMQPGMGHAWETPLINNSAIQYEYAAGMSTNVGSTF